ncbi:MAG: phosphopantetheine-binding protein [Casimicrobiaceae bacterium]
MDIASIRMAVFEALTIASPGTFNDEMRRSFLTGDADIALADLEMDSMAAMEFCIALELSIGISLLPSQLAELATTATVERRIREQLDEARK